MKVDNQGRPVGTVASKAPPARDKAESTSASRSPSVPEDTVSLSNAGSLRAVDHALANTPVVNTDKVNEIKQAIAEGRFSINPDAIADSLIDSVKELLAGRDHG